MSVDRKGFFFGSFHGDLTERSKNRSIVGGVSNRLIADHEKVVCFGILHQPRRADRSSAGDVVATAETRMTNDTDETRTTSHTDVTRHTSFFEFATDIDAVRGTFVISDEERNSCNNVKTFIVVDDLNDGTLVRIEDVLYFSNPVGRKHLIRFRGTFFVFLSSDVLQTGEMFSVDEENRQKAEFGDLSCRSSISNFSDDGRMNEFVLTITLSFRNEIIFKIFGRRNGRVIFFIGI